MVKKIVTKKLSPKQKNNVKIISKVLQRLSNGGLFREGTYQSILNTFLKLNNLNIKDLKICCLPKISAYY